MMKQRCLKQEQKYLKEFKIILDTLYKLLYYPNINNNKQGENKMDLNEIKEKLTYLKCLQEALAVTKKEEMKLRKELSELFMEGEIGRKKFDFEGYHIEVEQKLSNKVDKAVLLNLELSDTEYAALNVSYTLKAKEYKALSKDSKLHEAVVTSPSAPKLTIKLIGEK